MSRYDKYDPKVGGFRAVLAADWSANELGKIVGVGLNASGEVVKGAGNTGVVGVIVLTMARKAGEVVDVMTSGEIVEFGKGPGEDTAVAGTVWYANTDDGAVVDTLTEARVRVGHTVEADRLIVRFEPTALVAVP